LYGSTVGSVLRSLRCIAVGNVLFAADAVSEAGVSVVAMRGEIDLGVEAQMEACLAEALERSGPVLIDLCDVTFMDSTGLKLLLQARARLAAEDRRLALACQQTGAVMRLLDVSRAIAAFDIYPTREWALERLPG
jgi:anti-sigma B factor antagonist